MELLDFTVLYIWDILYGWFGLVLLLLGANDVLKWLLPAWGSSKYGEAVHEQRWKIGIALFILAQGIAYRDILSRFQTTEKSLSEKSGRVQILEAALRRKDADPSAIQPPSTSVDPQAASEHLKTLRVVLWNEGASLNAISVRMQNDGISLGIDAARSKDEYDKAWRPELLSLDLKNHYPEYFTDKAALELDVAKHDASSYALLSGIISAVPGSPDVQKQVGVSAFDVCQGRRGMALVNESAENVGFYAHGSTSGAGGGTAEELRRLYAVFQAFRPSRQLIEQCALLAKENMQLLSRTRALADEARRLSEVTSLKGTCQFIQ